MQSKSGRRSVGYTLLGSTWHASVSLLLMVIAFEAGVGNDGGGSCDGTHGRHGWILVGWFWVVGLLVRGIRRLLIWVVLMLLMRVLLMLVLGLLLLLLLLLMLLMLLLLLLLVVELLLVMRVQWLWSWVSRRRRKVTLLLHFSIAVNDSRLVLAHGGASWSSNALTTAAVFRRRAQDMVDLKRLLRLDLLNLMLMLMLMLVLRRWGGVGYLCR